MFKYKITVNKSHISDDQVHTDHKVYPYDSRSEALESLAYFENNAAREMTYTTVIFLEVSER